MRSAPSLARISICFLALAVFSGFSTLLHAADSAAGFVYVMDNQKPANQVFQFERASNGSLTLLRQVATGGSGSGPNGADPLSSQDSLVLSADGRLVFAANAGSNEVSVLGVADGRLTWLSKTSSDGTFPNSIAVFGDLVYVLNAKGEANITGFRLGMNGTLSWITTVPLPEGSTTPTDVRFTANGEHLLITLSGSNQILVFDVTDGGKATNPVLQPSAGGSPFGIRFGADSSIVVSEAAGSASSYHLEGETLEVISGAVSNTQKASCWLSITGSGREAFLSNTGSGTLSSYLIGEDGSLTLLAAIAADPGGAPIDSSFSNDSRFLYVLESDPGKLLIFLHDGYGLKQLGSVKVPNGSQGMSAR